MVKSKKSTKSLHPSMQDRRDAEKEVCRTGDAPPFFSIHQWRGGAKNGASAQHCKRDSRAKVNFTVKVEFE